jgi:hypothetical protein
MTMGAGVQLREIVCSKTIDAHEGLFAFPNF